MLVLAFLALSICGRYVTADPQCDPNVKAGTSVVFNNHCPTFVKFDDVKGKAYLDCLNDAGYKVYDGINVCSGKNVGTPMAPWTEMIKIFCDTSSPTLKEKSLTIMCCVITEEVIPIGKTGSDKVDISRICIDKLTGVC